MNILHLKYVVEVAKTKSISRAAENLFMGQPNLSRAIKELETKLGISIFERTMRGITVTPEGERFLEYAGKIVSQVNELESMYESGDVRQGLSVCAVNGICVEDMAVRLAEDIKEPVTAFNLGSNEAVISAVLNRGVNIGVIKYEVTEAGDYKVLLEDKKLECRSVGSYEYQLCAGYANTEFVAKNIRYEVMLIWREGYSLSECDRALITLFDGN